MKFCTYQQRRYNMNGRSQMQGGKNWILPKEINANRFFWDSPWLEIWKKPSSKGPNSGSLAMDSGSGRIVVKCYTGQVLPSRIGGLPVLEYKAGGHLLPHPVPGCLVKSDTEPLALRKQCANFSGCTQFSRIFFSFTCTQFFAVFPQGKFSWINVHFALTVPFKSEIK